VALDGRIAKTPGKKPLAVAPRGVAEALAGEWRAQAGTIDPATMPLTRLINAALDRVAAEMAGVRAEIVKYAGSDLICYRAETPAKLIAAQDAAWSPLVAWAKDALRVRLRLATGVVHVPQDAAVGEAVAAAVAPLDALNLAALHLAMTLTGSAIIALALARGRLTPDQAWAAAHIDEDWQMAQWGTDPTALAARAARRRDFDAAALVLAR
jgi:chaperone required for assembly of F1-ATPase